MTDRIISGVIGFFMGAVIGGYFVGRMCGKQHRKAIDELRNSYEEFDDSDISDDFDYPIGDEKKNTEPDMATLSAMYKSDRFDREMTRYSHPSEDENDPKDIHIIDEETFQRDINTRDNETLTYYQEDGVLVDAANNVIKNEETIIGVEASEKIFDCGDEYVYVSDEVNDKMYEIVVEHNQSFYRDVMGG